jgi:hypothetical protein
MEHEERAERMEHDAERMEHESERVGEHIEEAREDWEAKEEDSSVPGARPDPGEEKETATGNPDAAGSEEDPDSGEQ